MRDHSSGVLSQCIFQNLPPSRANRLCSISWASSCGKLFAKVGRWAFTSRGNDLNTIL